MNKEVSIIPLSYGNYVSLEDYTDLKKQLEEKQKIIDDAIKIIKKECFIEDKGKFIERYISRTPYEILEVLERGKNGK